MTEKNCNLFTIGHSNYAIDFFIKQLNSNNINYVIDVRSVPYSRYVPQFNKDNLKEKLIENNIAYVYMGDLLGARYSDSNLLYEDGKVNFKMVSQTKKFIEGIERLNQLIEKGLIISLMCSEKDPFDCHRFVLISKELTKNGINVQHILEDDTKISNHELEERLLKKYMKNYNQTTLSGIKKTKTEAIEEAYEKRNKDIAFMEKEIKEINEIN